MLQLRIRRSIKGGKSSERLGQATAVPTNPIPILLLSFVSQTVVLKLFDFQLRMFEKFIIKTFSFHNHVPTFKRWHWLDVGDSARGHLDRHRSTPVSSVLRNSIWFFMFYFHNHVLTMVPNRILSNWGYSAKDNGGSRIKPYTVGVSIFSRMRSLFGYISLGAYFKKRMKLPRLPATRFTIFN